MLDTPRVYRKERLPFFYHADRLDLGCPSGRMFGGLILLQLKAFRFHCLLRSEMTLQKIYLLLNFSRFLTSLFIILI